MSENKEEEEEFFEDELRKKLDKLTKEVEELKDSIKSSDDARINLVKTFEKQIKELKEWLADLKKPEDEEEDWLP